MPRKTPNEQTAPLWIEEGEQKTAPLITVAPIAPLDKVYTYTADEAILAALQPGQRVLVPFGRRSRLAPAFVLTIDRGPWDSTLKSVDSILDPAGGLDDHLIELGQWISRYYCCPLGRTLAAMVPAAVRRQSGFETVRHVRLTPAFDPASVGRLGQKQRALLDLLEAATEPLRVDELLASVGASRSSLRALIDRGWVEEMVTKRPPETSYERTVVEDPAFVLNEQQGAALDRVGAAMQTAEFRAVLLYGVSGSGKTEVYIQAIRRTLETGRQAIMLVPEIALTTQLMQRLVVRFERVAVVHSGLSDVQRSLMWEQIRSGETSVVIGTRSAVFAPCPRLGLIVVDEEQDTSFKNLQSPRFHVRDVAIMRAHMLGIPIVLGSATPSLEVWHNAKRMPAYERVDLPARVAGLPMPEVRIVDMIAEPRIDGQEPVFSRALRTALEQTTAAGQQAVILLNRRGFAAWLYCPSCGQRVVCPECGTSMVLHQSRGRLLCHHCHVQREIPKYCADPSCRALLARGTGGTERVETELHRLLPTARIQRADSDSMTQGRDYEKLITEFQTHVLDVLVGTQMIAKGLDFPNVALVGVIGADLTAAVVDFRASERLFQLVTQVAGRAGRADIPGQVIVQTTMPTLAALRFATQHDFDGFAASELPRRQHLRLPPYTRLVRMVVADRNDRAAAAQATALADSIGRLAGDAAMEGIDVMGPQPCAIERLRGMYRHELLVRAPTAGALQKLLETARHGKLLKPKVSSFVIDVDPVSLT